ncbi:DUF3429 family protein [Pontixanthobacter aestiaquae]|uniref:DUF3429 family protein n=1 Tax=Pontixanthobacter aestiaquae TaxID=1509367 RepID=A0A844Z7C5_9SPHN|nr:DUF3429 family protein [Pontixanthobacter aestiaquae]MDN3645589.1 DUF3429 family protein [Pontixanthobacter aestiaquae]MXO83414.1 DUF3429 family protein [Pontixanthobacter aestiaquae]
MDNDRSPQSFRTALALGYAGLLPQAAALLLAVQGGTWREIALSGGYFYAALIFSFLGGVWWGQALSNGKAPRWIYAAAVLPSLLALALSLLALSEAFPSHSAFVALGALIAGSPLVDRAIGKGGAQWMRLRWHLSLGLGVLTLALAFWA